MKTAVISDIHGNMEAFRSVLDDIESMEVHEVVCLGDMIGYGPDPDAVVSGIIDMKIPTVLGNHENVVVNPASVRWFNPVAREAVKKTREMISDKTVAFIKSLPLFILNENKRFVHGFPPDSPRKYLFQATYEDRINYFTKYEETICFVGHTHFLELVRYKNGTVEEQDIVSGAITLEKECKYIINAGSVGQPRDGDINAKYVIFDPESRELCVRFVPYDNEKTASKILKAGMPEQYARRLQQ